MRLSDVTRGRHLVGLLGEVHLSAGDLASRAANPLRQTQYASALHIVMATHGRTGLLRAVFGSVAGRILEHGATSLVLVRPVPPLDRRRQPARQ